MTGRLPGLDDSGHSDESWSRTEVVRARAGDPGPADHVTGRYQPDDDQADTEDDLSIAQIVEVLYGQPWRALAACRGLPVSLFYAERGESTQEAKEVCDGCLVREACLEYAMARRENLGMWGGMSERGRRELRRQRRLDAA